MIVFWLTFTDGVQALAREMRASVQRVAIECRSGLHHERPATEVQSVRVVQDDNSELLAALAVGVWV